MKPICDRKSRARRRDCEAASTSGDVVTPRLVDQLRASRSRLAGAGVDHRLRLERALHDGAQQRLMAIQIKLALLRDRLARDGLAAELDEIAEDAASAVEDLRAVAHGIYPTVLRERGLGDAIRAFGRTCSVPLEVAEALDGRCAPVVELALYGCATDAIRNAFQHGGAGVRLTVSLVRSGGDVALEVTDDGAGFDPTAESSGGGLVAMRDRMGAVGGDIEIVSAPGHGTTVRCRAAASGPATTDG